MLDSAGPIHVNRVLEPLRRAPLPILAAFTAALGAVLYSGFVLAGWHAMTREQVLAGQQARLEGLSGALASRLDPSGRDLADVLAAGAAPAGWLVTSDGRPIAGGRPPFELPADVLERLAAGADRASFLTGGELAVGVASVRDAGGRAAAYLVVAAPVTGPLAEAFFRSLRRAGGVLLCGIVLVPLAVLISTRRASEFLRDLADTARSTAAGDLGAAPPEPCFGRELAELGQAVPQMQAGIRALSAEMRDAVDLLGAAVSTLADATGAQSRTISQQATTLQETQVTAQEIKQTSGLAAERARAVLEVSERARELGRSGEEATRRSLDTLRDLRAQVEEIAQSIQALGDRSRQIGGITQSVKDLADQSNMLALNAAIEAVRSGDHGKSFAVVAREIRSLADQSIQATRQVRGILEDISGAVARAVSSTRAGAERMERGLEQMKAFGESFRELAAIVGEDAEAVRAIAEAVAQQNEGVAQIFAALQDQMRMMEESVARVASVDVAAAALKEIAEGVAEMARRFRVDGEGDARAGVRTA